MCDFEKGEKVQCINANPPANYLALGGQLTLRAIYTIHDKIRCPVCGEHYFVQVEPNSLYWWEAERFVRLRPSDNEVTERIKKYLRTDNPDNRPTPVKNPEKVPEKV